MTTRKSLLAFCCALATFPSNNVLAQSTLEEVIVTAQKRSQSVLDVPVTMDVISEDFLRQENITELDDLSRFLPNVVIQEQAVSLPSFNIRGITDDSPSISTTPRISVYQDGFDISKKTLASAALYDIERIEVLKGPQPTLFGVAAANGAVSIHSNKPTDELAAEGEIAIYSRSGRDLNAMVNVPINDIFKFRIAGIYREQDGEINNLACGPNSYNPSGKIENHLGELQDCAGGKLSGVSVRAVRASLAADTGRLSALLRVAAEHNKLPGISFKSGSIAPRGGNTSPFSDAELGYGALLGIDRELHATDLTVAYDINDATSLTLETFYKDVELTETFDADGSPFRIQDAYFDNDSHLYGASLRLVFDNDDRFAGFIGASYNREKSVLPYTILVDPYIRGIFDAKLAELKAKYPNIPLDQNVKTNASEADIAAVRAELVSVLFNPDGSPVSNPDGASTLVRGPFVFIADQEVRSLVAEGSYYITDALNLTAGLRYIDETRYTRNFGAFAAERDFSDTLPRLALNYTLSDNSSVYLNYARGRRSPVVDPNFGNTQITDAEIVDSIDLGINTQWQALILNAAIFMYSYTDYQQSFTDPVTLQANTVTVGDSDVTGFETTFSYQVNDDLAMGGSLGLLDAKFANSTKSGERFSWGGNRFRLAPEVSGALYANQGFDMGDYRLMLNVSATYQSEVFFEGSNYPGLSQDAYWIVDTSLNLTPASENWAVKFYADNVFDEEFLIDAGNTGGGIGIPTFVRGPGRNVGVRLSVAY